LSSGTRAFVELAAAPVWPRFHDPAPDQRAPNALPTRVASTRAAPGWRFYIRSLLKIALAKPIR
jgi:hypothetical protein